MDRVPNVEGDRHRSQQGGDQPSSTDISAVFLTQSLYTSSSNPSSRPMAMPRNVHVDRPGAYYVEGRASGQFPAWADNPQQYRSRSEGNLPVALLARSPVEAAVHHITLSAENVEMLELQVNSPVPNPRQGRSRGFLSRLVKGRGIWRLRHNAPDARPTRGHRADNEVDEEEVLVRSEELRYGHDAPEALSNRGHRADNEDDIRTRSEEYVISPSPVQSAQTVTTRPPAEPSRIYPVIAQPPTRGGHAGRDSHSTLPSSLQTGTNRSSNFSGPADHGPISESRFIVETQGFFHPVALTPEVTPSESITINQDVFTLTGSSIARNFMTATHSSFRQQRRDPRIGEVLEIFPDANLERVQELLRRHQLEPTIMILASEQLTSVVITDNVPEAAEMPTRDSSDPRIGEILEIFPSANKDLIKELLREHPMEAILMVLAEGSAPISNEEPSIVPRRPAQTPPRQTLDKETIFSLVREVFPQLQTHEIEQAVQAYAANKNITLVSRVDPPSSSRYSNSTFSSPSVESAPSLISWTTESTSTAFAEFISFSSAPSLLSNSQLATVATQRAYPTALANLSWFDGGVRSKYDNLPDLQQQPSVEV